MLLDDQKLLRELLTLEFEKLRAKNPAYSQRAFARKLGTSSGMLSSILLGKRRVSAKKAQTLLKALGLAPEMEAWMTPILTGAKKVEIHRALIELDRFEIIASPAHLNALNLLRTSRCEPTLKGLAARLKQTPEQVRPVLNRLIRTGMVKREGGRLVPAEQALKTPDNFAHEAVRSFHRKTLREAEKKITEVPVEFRDFSAITIPANPETLPEVRELIKKFRDEVCHLLNRGDQTDVYKLCVQLYPIAWEEKQ